MLSNFFQGSTVLRDLHPPTVFGELAILYNCKRTATVTAKTPTKVWKLERNVFQNIMRTTAKTRREELKKVGWLAIFSLSCWNVAFTLVDPTNNYPDWYVPICKFVYRYVSLDFQTACSYYKLKKQQSIQTY